MAGGDSLNTRQRRFVAAMLVAPTIEEAAKQAGIAVRTAYRYLNDPTVKRQLSAALDNALSQATTKAVAVGLLPPIEINQHGELIDGYHRWTAHRKAGVESIAVKVTQTKSDADLLALAYERNAHGVVAITPAEKKQGAIRMYADGTGRTEEEIATLLHVKLATAKGYLARIKRDNRASRNKRIWDAWLACETLESIAEKENITGENPRASAKKIIENVEKSDAMQKLYIFSNYQDPDWRPPLYSVWAFAKRTNKVKCDGNTEVRIVDNLLYLYTEPLGIVVDPFGGNCERSTGWSGTRAQAQRPEAESFTSSSQWEAGNWTLRTARYRFDIQGCKDKKPILYSFPTRLNFLTLEKNTELTFLPLHP